MINKYTGDVDLRLTGWPELILRYDWQAIAAIQSTFPDKALDVILKQDANALLELTLIGLRRHHPDMTVEMLREYPAQLAPLALKIGEALALAYNGPGTAAPNPPNRAERRATARKQKKRTR